jgi:IS5 family transposase
VFETNVHYPTDINLLLDAIRKVMFLTEDLCEKEGLSDWRQGQHNYKSLKKLMRKVQNKKRGHARSEDKKRDKRGIPKVYFCSTRLCGESKSYTFKNLLNTDY